MNEKYKTLGNGIGSLATLMVTALVWENVTLTILLLTTVTFALLYIEKSRAAIAIYFLAFILGPFAEACLIHVGAWQYSQEHLFGFPLWLPFVWGNAALMFNRLNIYINYLSVK